METLNPSLEPIQYCLLLHYALWPIYFFAATFLNLSGDWWQKLLD